MQIVDFARFRQWRQGYATFPGHAGFEVGEPGIEFVDEGLDHVFVDKQDLQRGATLAVE
ncbi:hypothetical protein D3C79_1101720 [compost metagenome]